jgi:hypothetical protein
MMPVYDVSKTVSANGHDISEMAAVHMPEFHPANARVLDPYDFNIFQDK